MDTLFHGVMGMALCSRTGVAGGRRGPVDEKGRRTMADWTLWAAFGFGVLPDLVSLGIHFAMGLFNGNGLQWHGIPEFVFVLYRITHSALGIAVCVGALAAWQPRLLLPVMAWPLHVLTDVPTHGNGYFLTPVLWPFSDWSFVGWSWWLFPRLFYGGWMVAGLLWASILVMRLSWRKT